MLQQQVLAWETTQTGFSFQFASNDEIIIEHDQYLQPTQSTLPGQVKLPFAALEALERLIQKAKAIKQGETLPAPSLFIAS